MSVSIVKIGKTWYWYPISTYVIDIQYQHTSLVTYVFIAIDNKCKHLQLTVQSVPITIYNNYEIESCSWRGVLDTALCDKDSPGTPVSSTNKTDRSDINAILSKVALKTINPTASKCKHTLLVSNVRIR